MIYIGNCSYKIFEEMMFGCQWSEIFDCWPDNFVNIYRSKNEDRAVTSCFRSKTERELNATRKNNIVPGPGTYDLKLEVTTYAQLPAVKIRPFPNFFFKMKTERQMTMPFRKHCLTMSAPAMPMPPDPPSPGPGSYQIVDYKGPSKKFMSRKLVKKYF